MKVGRGMHAFIEILFLNIRVTVHVNDTNILAGHRRNATHGGETDGMIATQNDRHGSRASNVRHGVADLIKGLFNIGRDGEDVTSITQTHLFAQINASFVIVGRVERRNASNALRTKPGTGTVRATSIKGNSHDGGVVPLDVTDIFDKGCLHERVDTGKMRKLSSGKGRDGLVINTTGTGETHFQTASRLCIRLGRWDFGFLQGSLPSFGSLHIKGTGVMVANLRKGSSTSEKRLGRLLKKRRHGI
mmetsp:Transcript_3591/g.6859  ORF Transcript_3591/g.6859 Transcript_3591/m.6859 type:complete len:246 (-) Transcript_3591:197-934(-)